MGGLRIAAAALFLACAGARAETSAGTADSSNGWGYGYADLLGDLENWRKDGNVRVDSVGASVQGRALWMVSITSPGDSVGRGGDLPERKRRIFVHARTHPAEVQALYVAREMIRYLLSDRPGAAEVRRDFIFNIIPMYNPDGVELGKARQNARDVDLESNWNKNPMEPEPIALKRVFMDYMSGPIPIEVALNLHSDQTFCSRFFVYHQPAGTSAAYSELEKTFIAGVQAHFPDSIENWNFYPTWGGGTGVQYPEGFWWTNHAERVMALTYEDTNCPNASGYDSTGTALAMGSVDYVRARLVAPVLARRASVTRMLLSAEGLRFPAGGPARWEILDPRGRRLAAGAMGSGGGLLAWGDLPAAPVRILSVRPASGPPDRLILPSR